VRPSRLTGQLTADLTGAVPSSGFTHQLLARIADAARAHPGRTWPAQYHSCAARIPQSRIRSPVAGAACPVPLNRGVPCDATRSKTGHEPLAPGLRQAIAGSSRLRADEDQLIVGKRLRTTWALIAYPLGVFRFTRRGMTRHHPRTRLIHTFISPQQTDGRILGVHPVPCGSEGEIGQNCRRRMNEGTRRSHSHG
jgi:hypothetical protein